MRNQKQIDWLNRLIKKYTANIEKYEQLASDPDTSPRKRGAYRANAVQAAKALSATKENLRVYLEENSG